MQNLENKQKMWLVLTNDIIDCFNIENFFETCMDENIKYKDQEYFEKIKNCNNIEMLK